MQNCADALLLEHNLTAESVQSGCFNVPVSVVFTKIKYKTSQKFQSKLILEKKKNYKKYKIKKKRKSN